MLDCIMHYLFSEHTSIHLTLFLGSPFTDGSPEDQGKAVGIVSIKRVYK